MIFVVSSWALTLAFVAFYLRAQRRLVLVARAAHELRGPLFAMQLGLHGLGGEPARLAAIELELQRAGRALDDLTAAPSGGRAETSRELVDLTELVESYAPAWSTLASGYGAQLRVEPPLIVTRFEGGELAAGAGAWSRRGAGADSPPHGREADAAIAGGTPPVTDAPSLGAAAGGVAPVEEVSAPGPAAGRIAPVEEASSLGPAAGRVAPVEEASAPGPAAGRVAPVEEASALGDAGGRVTPVAAARAAESAARRAMPSGAHAAATVFADPLRIAQACANLIGNAAEHGGGGVVRVRVRASGAQVRIEVADDGPGLPMSVTALTATARARRGRRGHGLAIAAAIAEHHGGRLHSAPSDGGARLMLEMPAANEPVVA